MVRYLALEGLPGAGKSTLYDRLKNEFSNIRVVFYDVLLETVDLAEYKKKFPTKYSAVDDWYLEQEKIRTGRMMDDISKGKMVISDRSILSTIAFSYARAKQNNELTYYSHFLDKIFTQDRLLPDAILFFHVNYETSAYRQKTGRLPRAIGPWDNEFFFRQLDFFYKHEVREMFPNIITFDIDTTYKNPKESYSILEKFLLEMLK